MIHTGNVRPVVLYWGGQRPSDLYLDELACGWAAQHPQWFRCVPVVPAMRCRKMRGMAALASFIGRSCRTFPISRAIRSTACGAPVVVDSARADFTTQCNLPEADFC